MQPPPAEVKPHDAFTYKLAVVGVPSLTGNVTVPSPAVLAAQANNATSCRLSLLPNGVLDGAAVPWLRL